MERLKAKYLGKSYTNITPPRDAPLHISKKGNVFVLQVIGKKGIFK